MSAEQQALGQGPRQGNVGLQRSVTGGKHQPFPWHNQELGVSCVMWQRLHLQPRSVPVAFCAGAGYVTSLQKASHLSVALPAFLASSFTFISHTLRMPLLEESRVQSRPYIPHPTVSSQQPCRRWSVGHHFVGLLAQVLSQSHSRELLPDARVRGAVMKNLFQIR